MQNSRLRSHTEHFGQIVGHKLGNPRIKRSSSSLLDHQVLRLQVCEKQQQTIEIFHKKQRELCDFFIREYIPLNQSRINLKKILNDRTDEIRLIKNANKIYFGGLDRKHRRTGDGILIDDKGKIYEGTFLENVKQGYGLQIYPNGNVYVGHFQNNKKHGIGTFYWYTLSPPTRQNAQYVQFYSGTWWGGLPDGKGSHQKNTGDIYDGEFKNGLKHGNGEEYFGNGDFYKGQYVNGMPQGYGVYIWADKSRYEGDFKQGLRNGYGIWFSGDGKEEYKGQYILDKKCGYGEYYWDKKHFLYKGHFQNDLRHGYGELFKHMQLEYKGEWIYGKIVENKEDLHSSHHKSRSNSRYNENSFIRTPKSQKLPSLSRLRPPASPIIKRIKTKQIQKSVSRSKSPVYRNTKNRSPTLLNNPQNLHAITKTFTLSKHNKLKAPLLRSRSTQNTLKKRPLSYNPKKISINQKPHYELLVKKCDKQNCGCNISIPLQSKSGKKGRKKEYTHFKTQNFCF